jgi:glycosyltransferase involved in cell wall biosynthesis
MAHAANTVAVLASYAPSLVRFRGPLIRAIIERGHRVIAIAPPEPGWDTTINQLGALFAPIPFARATIDPRGDILAGRRIEAVLRAERVDTLLTYTIKPVVYGIPAASRAGVQSRVALITGLGYSFGTESWRQRIVGAGARLMYRRALRKATSVLFQNTDDRHEFVHSGLVSSAKTQIVAGSGIDLDHYHPRPLQPSDRVRFLLVARLLADKGIREYVAAARSIQALRSDCEFHLLGPSDPNPMGILQRELDAWRNEGAVEIHPETEDVRPHMAACDVYVLPSYREGTPRTVLEAMATGRPIITTDAPGCRETTVDGDNGLLVPIKDPDALARAMMRLADDPALRLRMGHRSREIVETKYDVRMVNRDMMRAMELIE